MEEDDLEKRINMVEEREASVSVREKNIKEAEAKAQKVATDAREEMRKAEELRLNTIAEKDKQILSKNKELASLDASIAASKDTLSNLQLDVQKRKAVEDQEVAAYRSSKMAEANEAAGKETLRQMNAFTSSAEKLIREVAEGTSDNLQNVNQTLMDTFSDLVKHYKEIASANANILTAQTEKLNEMLEEQEKKAIELAGLEIAEKRIQNSERILKGRMDRFQQEVDKVVKEKYEELIQDIQAKENQIKELRAKAKAMQEELDKLHEKDDATPAQIEAMRAALEEARKERDELIKKYEAYNQADFDRIKRDAESYANLLVTYTELERQMDECRRENDRLRANSMSIDSLRFERDALRIEAEQRKAYLTRLNDEIDELRQRIEDASGRVHAAANIEEPIAEFRNLPKSSNMAISEADWLQNIINKCKESGFEFPDRLIYSFHTCLKTAEMSPLTVLAGISGTGKSKLPKLYARFGGLYFISLPVQPDWDSPQSLFGYYNSIEKRYNATLLLRAMVSFQKRPEDSERILDLSDRVLLVLLDEMNLAHVELYFADLLSKLEDQRGDKEPSVHYVELGGGDTYPVRLSNNVIWTGTMNEDETTKSLSDKVVDRGSIIFFPRPNHFASYRSAKIEDGADMIPLKLWNSWKSSEHNLNQNDPKIAELLNKYCKKVEAINDALRFANRALGHRVWQSIENYMVAHPMVHVYRDDEEKLAKALKYAFEEALVHKVMSKLRGVELSEELREKCFNPIKTILSEDGESGLASDFAAAIDNSISGVFTWDSASYLNEEYKF